MAATMSAGQALLPFVEWDTQAGEQGKKDFLNYSSPTMPARDTHRGNMRVRPFTANDIDGMIECGHAMHAESRYSRLSFNAAKMRRHIEAIAQIDRANWCGYVAVDDDNVIQGVIGGYVVDLPWTDDLVTYDFVLFVHPRARGTRAWKLLVLSYVEWAKQFNPREIIIGVSSGVEHERTGRLYEILGFKKLAETYVLEGAV